MSSYEAKPLRAVPLHRSLNRPNLVFGCDREMVMFAGLISGTMIFFVMEWGAALTGVLLWLFAVFALRRMAKADPFMRQIYMRNRTYKSYYTPRPSPFRVINDTANKRRMGNPWKR